MLLSGSAQVRDVHDGILTVAFTEGARKNFLASGHDEILRQALIDELGVAWKIEAIIDESIGKGPRSWQVATAGRRADPRHPQLPPGTRSRRCRRRGRRTPTAPPDWAVGPDDPPAPVRRKGRQGRAQTSYPRTPPQLPPGRLQPPPRQPPRARSAGRGRAVTGIPPRTDEVARDPRRRRRDRRRDGQWPRAAGPGARRRGHRRHPARAAERAPSRHARTPRPLGPVSRETLKFPTHGGT